MKKIQHLFRQGFIAFAIMMLVGIVPVPVFAQEDQAGSDTAQSQTSTETAPINDSQYTSPNSGSGPNGAASGTYQYNPNSGLWENDYYTYNSNTHETLPKVPLEYTYNHQTGLWDTYVWQYSASKGAYQQELVSVTAPPSGAILHGGPDLQSHEESLTPAPESQEGVQSSSESSGGHESSSQESQSSANNSSGSHYPAGGSLTFSNSGTITNYLDSTAQTGDAIVIANTTAGNATTGDATAMTNILNLLQSQSSLTGGGLATFTANIQGNVQGDFLIDPAHYMQPASGVNTDATKLTVNSENDASIANNINLSAASGNAAASQNTTAGNVTSGDANAIANVINMINSVVAANQSFVGTINIYGDYSGNILMPTESLNALLASTGGSTTVADAAISANSDHNITNNVDLAAASGTATATENTKAGNVNSGNGMTNLTILNLTGKQVVAANSLLVFVNVLGSWVGLIMDAPAGSTAAALGGGVTADTSAIPASATIDVDDKFGITNNITANASSGNADASKNTTVGDVKSGDATASANVANLIGSNLNLSNWFGVLFINVFGTWRGNFGVAKPPVVPPITSGISGPGSGATAAMNDAKVFAFTPRGAVAASNSNSGNENLELSPLSEANHNAATTSKEVMERVSKVLSSSVGNPQNPVEQQTTVASAFEWSAVAVALGLAGLGFVGIDRVRTNLRNKRLHIK